MLPRQVEGVSHTDVGREQSGCRKLNRRRRRRTLELNRAKRSKVYPRRPWVSTGCHTVPVEPHRNHEPRLHVQKCTRNSEMHRDQQVGRVDIARRWTEVPVTATAEHLRRLGPRSVYTRQALLCSNTGPKRKLGAITQCGWHTEELNKAITANSGKGKCIWGQSPEFYLLRWFGLRGRDIQRHLRMLTGAWPLWELVQRTTQGLYQGVVACTMYKYMLVMF